MASRRGGSFTATTGPALRDYLLLYIFCGELLRGARLRPSNLDAAAGSKEELARIVKQIRAAWPEERIIVRGDASFCREEWLAWCEAQEVDYVVGLAKTGGRLVKHARYYWLLLAKSHLTRRLFASMLGRSGSGSWRLVTLIRTIMTPVWQAPQGARRMEGWR